MHYIYIYIYIQEAIDADLDAIVSGLASLRGLAEDIHSEVKVQAVMIDEIAVQVFVYSIVLCVCVCVCIV